jgi:cytochrome c oxidase subunit II
MAAEARRALLIGLAVASSGCRSVRVLDARSPDAAAIVDLWWILLALTGIPAVLTIAVLVLAAVRTPAESSRVVSTRRQTWIILLAGAALPLVIIITLLTASVGTSTRVRSLEAQQALTIDVIGRQFWWEVRYPDHDIVTANEVHIPVGQPVRLRITSGDVIHSFWVPQLHGKRDMMPGKVDELWLHAEQVGVYRGQCAEFCGIQHALMLFEVVALSADAFDDWLEVHRQPVTEPVDPLARRGLAVYEAAECGHCHNIEGITPETAAGVLGPDLTHIASRRTLGAGILANNRGNLGGWILGPQTFKPGNNMPASVMAPDDLHALLFFLETLR